MPPTDLDDMPTITTKIRRGDIFSVDVGDNRVKYFQYVDNDLTLLNSDVIRAFKKPYSLDSETDLSEVAAGESEFHAHCVVKWGIKLGFWKKVGIAPVVGKVEVLFRDTNDYGHKVGEEPVRVSNNWYVWKINEDFLRVGKLAGENRKAEIGLVINPESIIHRIQTGRYDLVAYPDYQ